MTPVQRAGALQILCRDVIQDMEVAAHDATMADRLAFIEIVVEIVNKCLYSLTVSQEMLDEIDELLNHPYQAVRPTPESIVPLFFTALTTLRLFEQHVARWTT